MTQVQSLAHVFAPKPSPSSVLFGQLGTVCRRRGHPGLAENLASLAVWIAGDLADFQAELSSVERGAGVVRESAAHLLDLGGKHLRPMCVALAAKLGGGFSEPARQLAVAVELVHAATLLHDDVIDLGDRRRGAAAARIIYGNAASIFAGDWLLVEALRRIRRAQIPTLLDFMLAIIEEMILAESVQLEQRGNIDATLDDYFRVVEGKTAALFRWAMVAGGRAGGLGDSECAALDKFGENLGVAFQAIDDLLDVAGDPSAVGKSLLSDVREGKMTYPLRIALGREPSLSPTLSRCAQLGGDIAEADARHIITTIVDTGAVEACRELASTRVSDAIAAIAAIPESPGKAALITVAKAMLHRER
ncbi:MAG TPA: polyprenyl synthetase family protein [Kofleriaceae bacterium]|nr:polyprenyl synthetase family protein [Kofleriaceae bacterium]